MEVLSAFCTISKTLVNIEILICVKNSASMKMTSGIHDELAFNLMLMSLTDCSFGEDLI